MNKRLGHVFLVDDNHDVRFYLADMLVRLGYTVDTFDNAQAFLNNALDISPAVVLLDMRMPGLTGLELQNKLLSIGRRTPIVFISGESEKTEIIEAFRHGAIDFVLKPFSRAGTPEHKQPSRCASLPRMALDNPVHGKRSINRSMTTIRLTATGLKVTKRGR